MPEIQMEVCDHMHRITLCHNKAKCRAHNKSYWMSFYQHCECWMYLCADVASCFDNTTYYRVEKQFLNFTKITIFLHPFEHILLS